MFFATLESAGIVIVLCSTVAPSTCARYRSAVTATDVGFINARPVRADWFSKTSGNSSCGCGLLSSGSAVKLRPWSRTSRPSSAVLGESTRSQPSRGCWPRAFWASSVELLLTDPNGGITKLVTDGALKDGSNSVTLTGIDELVGLVKTS